jgi:uncharacterized protein (TIGR03435 family)
MRVRLPCAFGFAILSAGVGLAQTTDDQPRFELASVKPSPPGDKIGSMNGGPMGPGPFNTGNHDPERITWTNIRLIRVLMMAYDLPADRISGPGWLHTEMYDIVAPVPKGTSVMDFKLMVRNLLAERFKLTLHRETKEVSGYALEIARGALKIKESRNDPQPAAADAGKGANPLMIVDDSGFPAPRAGNSVFLPGAGFSATIKVDDMNRATVLNQSMPTIAKFLGTAAGMPVEDETGLTGTYSFHLEYKPNQAEPPAADIVAPGPDLFDAVQTQLGLKLVRKRVPQETLVIDHAEKVPTEN